MTLTRDMIVAAVLGGLIGFMACLVYVDSVQTKLEHRMDILDAGVDHASHEASAAASDADDALRKARELDDRLDSLSR